MITDAHSGTRIDEIAKETYRISIPVDLEAIPGGFSFNHFLIGGDEPVLFHTGYRRTFPLVRDAIAAVLPPATLRHIGYSHHEPDESGAMMDFLGVAANAQVFSSDIGAMVSQGDLYDCPARGLADGEEFVAGSHHLVWIATPHVPHGWDCGILFDKTTGTLFCGDLFTQGGARNPPVSESEILTNSEQFRKPMDYFAHSVNTSTTLAKIAARKPSLLACQHGSSYRGDGSLLLLELSRVLERERAAVTA